MIKLHKIRVLLVFTVALLAMGGSNVPSAQATTDDNGHVIINEPDIRQTPQEIQEKKDDKTRQNIIELAVFIAVIAIGLVVYLNKGKSLKKKKNSRKK